MGAAPATLTAGAAGRAPLARPTASPDQAAAAEEAEGGALRGHPLT